MNGESILQVNDLQISFSTYAGEVQAVRGVSFDLRRGETRFGLIVVQTMLQTPQVVL